MTALVVLEGIVILMLVVLVAGLLRSHAEILRRLHELGAGEVDRERHGLQIRTSAPKAHLTSVTGATPSGGEASIALANSRGLVLLAFLTSGCASCRTFWETFDRGVALPSVVRPVIVTKGPAEESPATIRGLAAAEVTVVMSTEAWDAFAVPVAPYFALVDASQSTVVGEGAAASWDRVSDLVTRALGDAALPGPNRGSSTAARLEDTDEELRRAGIEPGDESLYHAPTDGELQ